MRDDVNSKEPKQPLPGPTKLIYLIPNIAVIILFCGLQDTRLFFWSWILKLMLSGAIHNDDF